MRVRLPSVLSELASKDGYKGRSKASGHLPNDGFGEHVLIVFLVLAAHTRNVSQSQMSNTARYTTHNAVW